MEIKFGACILPEIGRMVSGKRYRQEKERTDPTWQTQIIAPLDPSTSTVTMWRESIPRYLEVDISTRILLTPF